MRAIKHYQDCFNGKLPADIDSAYTSALIILQGKSWVHYSVLLNTEVVWTDKLPMGTAATDGIYVYVDPDYFMSMPDHLHRASILFHEIEHVILRHPLRGKFYRDRGYHSSAGGERLSFNGMKYNVAADYVVNADMLAHGLPVHAEWLRDSRFSRDDLVDHVYIQIMREQQPEQQQPEQSEKQEGSGQGSDEKSQPEQSEEADNENDSQQGGDADESGENQAGAEDEDEDTTGTGTGDKSDESDTDDESSSPRGRSHGVGQDDHFEPMYAGEDEEDVRQQMEQDKAEIERKIDDAIDSMADAQKRGERPKDVSQNVKNASFRNRDDGDPGTVDWRSELIDRVTRSGNAGDLTFKKIHRRRYATLGIISPTRIGVIDQMVWTIDISGSVSREAYEQAAIVVAYMIDLMQPTSGCLVLFCNTSVIGTAEVFTGQDLLDLDVPMGGGTRMAAAIDWLEANGIMPDVHLCFTDGYIPYTDWGRMAETDTICVLDRHPDANMAHGIREAGVHLIVANDEPLAA